MSGEEQKRGIPPHANEQMRVVKPSAVAMGNLAASIGHEFNNPLGYVCSSVDYCKNYLTKLHDKASSQETLDAGALKDEFSQLIEALHDAQDGLARMNRIMHELQGFTSLRQLTMAPVNLDDLIGSLLKRAAHDGLEVDYQPSARDLHVRGDAIQLTQALEHVISNAWHATGASEDRSRIRVSSSMRDAKIVVSVQDYGVGMSEHVRQTMFDPFMTTRGVQGRLGLGLTFVHQIVLAHGGEVYAQSEPGHGTTISIVLQSLSQDELIMSEQTLTLETPLDLEDTDEHTPHVVIVSSDAASSQELALLLSDTYDVDVFDDVSEALAFIAVQPHIGFVFYDLDMLADQWRDFHDALDPRYTKHVGLLMAGIPDLEMRRALEQTPVPVFSRPLRARTTLEQLGRLIKTRPV